MLRRLALREFVIVDRLEVDFGPGFTVLTGETGAGKSILVDALQLALGARGDVAVVREGAARAEIGAEFDTPAALATWLEQAGFDAAETLLLRRTIDREGKSRAWINGSPATVGQLREAAEHLVEIHGQHAWVGLTRPAAVRALLDAQAGVDAGPLVAAWTAWKQAREALDDARGRQDTLARERERLQWQIGEIERLAPADGEWEEIEAEHRRLAHAQALLEAAQGAVQAVDGGDAGEVPGAASQLQQAIDALDAVREHDARLGEVAEVLRSAQAALADAGHSLAAYLNHHEPNPQRLAELDTRLAAWIALARRHRRPPAELPALRASWRDELATLDAAGDLQALEQRVVEAERVWQQLAQGVSQQRQRTAPQLSAAVSAAMQQLGMAGGRFEVVLVSNASPEPLPQAHGLESIEFHVAAHAGATPRPVAKVASGGELSRLALAIAVTTTRAAQQAVGTLIFDEIDAGVGGAVADQVGRLMKQLGAHVQVLAVTHLAQVAACADAHRVVAKATHTGITTSTVEPVNGEARVTEIARMLGGDALARTSRAHAQALLGGAK